MKNIPPTWMLVTFGPFGIIAMLYRLEKSESSRMAILLTAICAFSAGFAIALLATLKERKTKG